MRPDFIDIHAHLNFAAFDADREEVAKRAQDAGVGVISVGTQLDTSRKAVELAEKYENMWAIVGLHPIHTSKSYHDMQEFGEGGKGFTSRGEEFDYKSYKKLLEHPKVVGVGECGLDFFRIKNHELGITNVDEEKKRQVRVFEQQIELAIEMNKPLMIHSRNAYRETFEILNSYFKIHNSRLRAHLHFFAGTWEEAEMFLDLGFTLSFTGVITFARTYDEVIRNTPLNQIMSETDCPYVAPVLYRGKRNEPAYVVEVVKKIAEIRGENFEKVCVQLFQNAVRFFELNLKV